MEQRTFNKLFLVVLIAGLGVTIGLQGYNLIITQTKGDSGSDPIFLHISGSTTCFPIITECAERFMENYTNYDIRVSSGGSSTGITNAIEGLSEIGMSSRNIKTDEYLEEPNLIDWQFVADGIAIIFDNGASHGVTELTMEQLFLIYNGTYTTWNTASQYGVPALGGSADAIEVVTRAEGSGTRGSFEELVQFNGEELGDDDGYINNVNSFHTEDENPLVASYIASHEFSIGYVGLGFYDDVEHHLVPINSTIPTEITVLDGSYPIARRLHLVTNGLPNIGTMSFINYVFGPIGQQIAEDEGFIALYHPR